MALESFRRACDRFVAENTRTLQDAFACLVRIGILLPNGELAPEYGR